MPLSIGCVLSRPVSNRHGLPRPGVAARRRLIGLDQRHALVQRHRGPRCPPGHWPRPDWPAATGGRPHPCPRLGTGSSRSGSPCSIADPATTAVWLRVSCARCATLAAAGNRFSGVIGSVSPTITRSRPRCRAVATMAALSTAASAAIVSTDNGAWPMRLGACWAWALPAPAASSTTTAIIGRRRLWHRLAAPMLRMGMQLAPCGRRLFGPIQPSAKGNGARVRGHDGQQQPKPFVTCAAVHLAGGKISISAILHVGTIRFTAVARAPIPPLGRVSTCLHGRGGMGMLALNMVN